MNTAAPSIYSFHANGLHVGGIYPFRIKGLQSISVPSIFKEDFSDRNEFTNYKRAMYGPEQKWFNPAKMFYFETVLSECTLSNGREFKGVSFQSHLSIYPLGFATLIHWIDLSKYSFGFEEIIELAALTRGTKERISDLQKTRIVLEWKNQTKRIENFTKIGDLIEKELRSTISNTYLPDSSNVQFLYPIVYVSEVPDCDSAQDIINKYATVVAGIANLWEYGTPWLKQEEVQRLIQTDYHPFEYGLTCFTNTCTVELHPKNLQQVIEKRGVSANKHHYRERTFLSFLCEVPVAQFFVMRNFDEELATMQGTFLFPKYASFLNPIYLFKVISHAIKLTRLHQELTNSIDLFRNRYFTRKSYIPRAIEQMREAFGTDKVEASIDKKLEALQSHLEMTYSMVTTVFLTILSVIGVILALIQALGAAQSLGWIKK